MSAGDVATKEIVVAHLQVLFRRIRFSEAVSHRLGCHAMLSAVRSGRWYAVRSSPSRYRVLRQSAAGHRARAQRSSRETPDPRTRRRRNAQTRSTSSAPASPAQRFPAHEREIGKTQAANFEFRPSALRDASAMAATPQRDLAKGNASFPRR